MSYIGNARSLLVINSNVRDDLIPEKISGVWKDTFELSQEVPGGFEGNVTVIRQKYVVDPVVEGAPSNKISIQATGMVATLTCNDPALSAALSAIRNTDHLLVVKVNNSDPGRDTSFQGQGFTVDSVEYTGIADSNGNYITINFQVSNITETSQVDDTFDISYGYAAPWEVLDPENDYEIEGTGDLQNRIIRLIQAPGADDKVYVLHRAEGTYKFAPSAKSVGPEQLSENLRNFLVDRYTCQPNQAIFELSQPAISAGSLIVTVNGVIADSIQELDESLVASPGEYFWALSASGTQIEFHQDSIPPTGSKVRVVHLGFTTVSRRAKFATGQASNIPPLSVGTDQLKNNAVTTLKVAESAITAEKLAADSATGAKILLNNNEFLRAKNSSGVALGLLKLNAQNKTVLQNSSEVAIEINSVNKVSVTSDAILPETNNDLSLGSSSKKLKDVFVAGNISVDGTVDGADISDLKQTVDAILAKINNGDILPIGAIMMWGSSSAPISRGWLRCDGSPISRVEYSELFAIVGTTFGVGDGSTTFNLPDLRTRAPVGSNATGTNVAANEGKSVGDRTITHSHIGGVHQHGLANHTHAVPGHHHVHSTALGSTLAISISSGAHTTNVDHTHENALAIETANKLDKITWPETGGRHNHPDAGQILSGTNTPSINHNHRSWWGSAFSPISGDQKISENQALSLNHSHGIWARGVSDQADSSLPVNPHDHDISQHNDDPNNETLTVSTQPEGGSDITLLRRRTRENSSGLYHTHGITRFYTDSAYTLTAIPGNENAWRTQTDQLTNGANKTPTDLNHQHPITITNSGIHNHAGLKLEYKGVDVSPIGLTLADRGKHTHNASDFSGAIGKVTGGANGNDSILSDPSATTNTDSSGAVNTSEGVSPYLVVNFIIKAKQV